MILALSEKHRRQNCDGCRCDSAKGSKNKDLWCGGLTFDPACVSSINDCWKSSRAFSFWLCLSFSFSCWFFRSCFFCRSGRICWLFSSAIRSIKLIPAYKLESSLLSFTGLNQVPICSISLSVPDSLSADRCLTFRICIALYYSILIKDSEWILTINSETSDSTGDNIGLCGHPNLCGVPNWSICTIISCLKIYTIPTRFPLVSCNTFNELRSWWSLLIKFVMLCFTHWNFVCTCDVHSPTHIDSHTAFKTLTLEDESGVQLLLFTIIIISFYDDLKVHCHTTRVAIFTSCDKCFIYIISMWCQVWILMSLGCVSTWSRSTTSVGKSSKKLGCKQDAHIKDSFIFIILQNIVTYI